MRRLNVHLGAEVWVLQSFVVTSSVAGSKSRGHCWQQSSKTQGWPHLGRQKKTDSSLFALSKPNNPRPVPSLMALSSDRSSLLFLSRSVAVQVQEHQKRFCRRPLDGRVTERHMDAQAPPCSSQRRWGCRRPPPAREAARPVRPPSGWSGLSGGLGVWVGSGSGSGSGFGEGGRAMVQRRGT